jgi:hypothetical protein
MFVAWQQEISGGQIIWGSIVLKIPHLSIKLPAQLMDFIKGCTVRIYVKTTQMTGKGEVFFRESTCKAL